jgi:Tfp pilus assembly protein PilF
VARGNAFMRKGDAERATADYNAALRLDKDDSRARRSLERVAASRGGPAVAREPDALADQVETE